ncbi:hypothetical protein BDN71DRAFT_1426475 [Pleurotus eryngii]|uniref:Uncharacterized protein n=1 Tax=Pleurotus eryngii TaxID=5323 RepID=A0A9P6DL90_PLEER|nr:hypothetical protein BDN71DRAFT_1426475 [Pleurotus eryngii]
MTTMQLDSIHTCPPEIWTRIFAFACTDDGATGCSLALVSRYVRETSEPVRFERVILKGVDKIVAFADMLEVLEEGKRRLNTLDIVVDVDAEEGTNVEEQEMRKYEELDSHAYLNSLHRKTKCARSITVPYECRSRGIVASGAITHILDMVAPYLQDLSIWFNATYERTFVLLPNVDLPELRRFAFRGERVPFFSGSSGNGQIKCEKLKEMTVVWDQFPMDVVRHVKAISGQLMALKIVCRSPGDFMTLVGLAWQRRQGNVEECCEDNDTFKSGLAERIVCCRMASSVEEGGWDALRKSLEEDSRFCVL